MKHTLPLIFLSVLITACGEESGPPSGGTCEIHTIYNSIPDTYRCAPDYLESTCNEFDENELIETYYHGKDVSCQSLGYTVSDPVYEEGDNYESPNGPYVPGESGYFANPTNFSD